MGSALVVRLKRLYRVFQLTRSQFSSRSSYSYEIKAQVPINQHKKPKCENGWSGLYHREEKEIAFFEHKGMRIIRDIPRFLAINLGREDKSGSVEGGLALYARISMDILWNRNIWEPET